MQPARFKKILKGKVVIVGIGNPLRRDDGFGPALIERLTLRLPAGTKGKVVCFDAGSVPENYAVKMVNEKPDTILIVDALYLGKPAGEYEILQKGGIASLGLSTHDTSPEMLIEFLEAETGADIYILGVQPESMDLEIGLTKPVRQTLEKIEEWLVACLNRE